MFKNEAGLSQIKEKGAAMGKSYEICLRKIRRTFSLRNCRSIVLALSVGEFTELAVHRL